MSLSISCELECDRCKTFFKGLMVAANLSPFFGDDLVDFSVHAWNVAGSERWGMIWKKRENGDSWKQALFCQKCYEFERSLIPKKKGFFENVFG